jgi:hypothetical protein
LSVAAPEPVEITTPDPKALAPLWHQYPGQTQPQGAYLEIRPQEREASWGYNPEVSDGVPYSVHYAFRLRITCANDLTGSQIVELSKRLRPLIVRVCDGHKISWNGVYGVGQLDDDAEIAENEIRMILEQTAGEAQIWEASDWISMGDHDWPELCAQATVDPERRAGVVDAVVQYLGEVADHDGILIHGIEHAVRSSLDEWEEQQEEASNV